jgi:hypothetical protein
MELSDIKSTPIHGRIVTDYEVVVLDRQVDPSAPRKTAGRFSEADQALVVARTLCAGMEDMEVKVHKVTRQQVTIARETIFDSTKED